MSPLLGYDTILPPPFTGILLRLPTLWAAAVFRHGWTQNRRGFYASSCAAATLGNGTRLRRLAGSALVTGSLPFLRRGQPTGALSQEEGGPSACAAAANTPEKSPFLRPFLCVWVKSTLFQMWTAAGTFHFPKWAGFKLVPVIAHTLPGRRKLRRFYFCWHNTSGNLFLMN